MQRLIFYIPDSDSVKKKTDLFNQSQICFFIRVEFIYFVVRFQVIIVIFSTLVVAHVPDHVYQLVTGQVVQIETGGPNGVVNYLLGNIHVRTSAYPVSIDSSLVLSEVVIIPEKSVII